MSINPGFYLFLPISQPGSLDFCQFWGSLDIPPVSSPLLYLVKVCFFWPSKAPPLGFGTTDNGTEKRSTCALVETQHSSAMSTAHPTPKMTSETKPQKEPEIKTDYPLPPRRPSGPISLPQTPQKSSSLPGHPSMIWFPNSSGYFLTWLKLPTFPNLQVLLACLSNSRVISSKTPLSLASSLVKGCLSQRMWSPWSPLPSPLAFFWRRGVSPHFSF